MADDDLHDQISSLEAHIDELTGVIESCRKLILKVAIAAGGIWLLAFTFGAIRFDSVAIIGAISAVIGGTVVFGSNTSTSKQAAADIKAAEALRAELIDKINLQLVGEAEGNCARVDGDGYTNKGGAPYSASCVKSMVEGPTPSAISRAMA
jgi:hypothetical protein